MRCGHINLARMTACFKCVLVVEEEEVVVRKVSREGACLASPP